MRPRTTDRDHLRHWSALLAATCALTLFAAACGGGGESTAPAKQGNAGVVENNDPPVVGGSLVYGIAAETNGWNPSNSQWAPSGVLVSRTFFDTLSAYDSDSKIQPFLAAAFDHNDAYTEWTISIRPGITLHNGKPVTATTIKLDQDFLKASRLTGSAYEPVDSFTVASDLKVVVKMNQPWVNYPYALATQIGVVTDPDWLVGGDASKPIGTGPFTFDHWIPEKELVVKKNPSYWRKDAKGGALPYLNQVEFRPIADDTTRGSALQNNDIQAMQTSSADEIIRFQKLGETGQFQVFNETKGETSEVFVMTNGMAPPLNDLDARKALAYATDKKAIIDVTAQGLYQAANGPFSPSSKWYAKEVETLYPQFDPVKAKEYVAKVKAKNGGKFEFTLGASPSPATQRIEQQLQQQWADAGITVTLEQIELAPLIVKVLTGGYQAVMWQQFDSPHPLGDSIWWHPNTAKDMPDFALNFARNRDPEIGKLLDNGRQTTDPAQELADYKDVQKRLAEDVPYIWLYHSQISVIARPNVVNVTNWTLPPNAAGEMKKGLEIQNGSHQIAQIWLKPA